MTITPTTTTTKPFPIFLPLSPPFLPPPKKTMFDPKTEFSNHHFHPFNPPKHTIDSWGTTNLVTRAQKTAQNYENYTKNHSGGNVHFMRAEKKEDDDDSGVSSPPLWKNNYRYLSPNSRSQAIARGQWELMEMVKTMPESCYELSLKDIVEIPNRVEAQEKCLVGGKVLGVGIKRQESKKSDNKAKIVRSRSIDSGGFLLKMVFPFSFGSKKKGNSATNSCSRVSPDKSLKGDEKEWWKKRFSVSSGSESVGISSSHSGSSGSGGSSSNSSRSNSRRKRSGCSPGCWSFPTKKNKKSSQ